MTLPRLAMLDVDGTLRLGPDWLPGAPELLAALAAWEVPVALCSGRHVESLRLLAAELPGVRWLGGSGGAVVERRTRGGWETVTQRLLPTAVVDRVFDAVEAAGVEAWVYTTSRLVVGHWTPAVEHEMKLTGVHPVVANLRGRDDVLKILILASSEEAIAHVRQAGTADGCRVVQSFPGYLDVVRADAADDKGGEILTEDAGITWADVVAIGDGENDIGMLSQAGIAVCLAPLPVTALWPATEGQHRSQASNLAEALAFIRGAVRSDSLSLRGPSMVSRA